MSRLRNRVSVGLLLLFAVIASMAAAFVHAQPIQLTQLPDESLGLYAQYLVESEQRLSLAEAQARHRSGDFRPGRQRMPNFGIGSRPVWIRLDVDNPTSSLISIYLLAGVTWLDQMDVYVQRSGQLDSATHTGDEVRDAPGLTPALGYALPLDLASGPSEIYLRVESVDPMAVPIELLSREQLELRRLHYGYFYGFVFGFLASLCIYNLLLFAGLKERSYLYYSLALLSIMLCNLGYTGHGLAWLWPHLPGFQRYIVLVMMVAYSAIGLLFASRFLLLADYAPRISKAISWLVGIESAAMLIALLMQSHELAALVAFLAVLPFSILMVLLGVLAVRRGRVSGLYFLAATIFGSLGAAITGLAVWGKIPFGSGAFHAVEFGLIIEATLLAMALAYKIRQYQHANLQAEELARRDPLTALLNRRAFMEFAEPCMSSAERGQRPLSVIMMDIDHFKQINDQHGHRSGDDVLRKIASLLRQYSRASDIVSRWGGEEFILLLMETDLGQASQHAERLRQGIAEIRVNAGAASIAPTSSFGVAQLTQGMLLEDLIQTADTQLYRAKSEGRNRVCNTLTAVAS